MALGCKHETMLRNLKQFRHTIFRVPGDNDPFAGLLYCLVMQANRPHPARAQNLFHTTSWFDINGMYKFIAWEFPVRMLQATRKLRGQVLIETATKRNIDYLH